MRTKSGAIRPITRDADQGAGVRLLRRGLLVAERDIGVTTLARIASALGVSLQEFFKPCKRAHWRR